MVSSVSALENKECQFKSSPILSVCMSTACDVQTFTSSPQCMYEHSMWCTNIYFISSVYVWAQHVMYKHLLHLLSVCMSTACDVQTFTSSPQCMYEHSMWCTNIYFISSVYVWAQHVMYKHLLHLLSVCMSTACDVQTFTSSPQYMYEHSMWCINIYFISSVYVWAQHVMYKHLLHLLSVCMSTACDVQTFTSSPQCMYEHSMWCTNIYFISSVYVWAQHVMYKHLLHLLNVCMSTACDVQTFTSSPQCMYEHSMWCTNIYLISSVYVWAQHVMYKHLLHLLSVCMSTACDVHTFTSSCSS